MVIFPISHQHCPDTSMETLSATPSPSLGFTVGKGVMAEKGQCHAWTSLRATRAKGRQKKPLPTSQTHPHQKWLTSPHEILLTIFLSELTHQPVLCSTRDKEMLKSPRSLPPPHTPGMPTRRERDGG